MLRRRICLVQLQRRKEQTMRLLISAFISAGFLAGSFQPSAAQDRSGFYGGIAAGANVSGDFLSVPNNGFPPTGGSLSGQLGSVFIGYNIQRGALVYGAELAVSVSDVGGGGLSGGRVFDSYTDLKARAGYAFGDLLAYGVAGLSQGNLPAGVERFAFRGPSYGIGVDYRIDSGIFTGAEYLIRDLEEDAPGGHLEADGGSLSLRLGIEF
jgi:outer membrane immunogenic protein